MILASECPPAMAPRLPALHRAEDIGSALKRGVNVCQRQLVNEVLGPLVTEFVRNFGREGATPIQLGPNVSLFGRVQAVKLVGRDPQGVGVQVHYDEGVGAARLAAILAGESPVSRGVQSLL